MQLSDFLPRALFIGSIAAGIFSYGVVAGNYEVFPHQMLSSARYALVDLRSNYRSYLGIEPTKFLNQAKGVDNGVTVYNADDATPGLTLISSLFDGKVGLQLIDMDGTIVHSWSPVFSDIFPDTAYLPDDEVPRNDWDTLIHGLLALPDGSVVFNFDQMGLVKLDWCGAVVWTLPRNTHHSVDVADDGSFWVPSRITRQEEDDDDTLQFLRPSYEETVLHISSAGKVLREISLLRVLIEAGYEGALLPTGTNGRDKKWRGLLHLNDVDVLGRDEASAFPLFAAGDLMVSMRNLNLIVVFDPNSGKIKWHQTGPWLRQHDPDFAPDGRIVVFNNRDGIEHWPSFGGSNILAVDPKTRQITVLYAGSEHRPFFTARLGAQQLLQNGNILITSSLQGRVFEVDRTGTVVWEYVNRYDKDRVVLIGEAYRYKPDYFRGLKWNCD